jgi:hypothetical protein
MTAEPEKMQAWLADFETQLAQVEIELAELEDKRAALKETVAGLRKLLNVGSSDVATSAPRIPKGAYKGMSIVEAAEKYLHMVNRPQTNREVVAALAKGGKTGSAGFTDTVRSVISRHAKKKGTFRWRNNKWELSEWPQDDS